MNRARPIAHSLSSQSTGYSPSDAREFRGNHGFSVGRYLAIDDVPPAISRVGSHDAITCDDRDLSHLGIRDGIGIGMLVQWAILGIIVLYFAAQVVRSALMVHGT